VQLSASLDTFKAQVSTEQKKRSEAQANLKSVSQKLSKVERRAQYSFMADLEDKLQAINTDSDLLRQAVARE